MKKDMQSLLNEGRCLQQPYRKSGSKKQGDFDYARHFNDLMSCGKVHEALGMLNTVPNSATGKRPLQIDDTVMLQNGRSASVKELLLEKHPKAQTPPPEVLLSGQPSSVHPVFFFYSLSAELLKKVALHSRGSACPSGLNSSRWRRMCSSFKGSSSNLRAS